MELRELEAGRLLALHGRLDAASAADLRGHLHRAVDEGTGDLVVDLAGAEIRDGVGLGVLLGTHRRADRAGRRLVLRDVPAPVQRLLRRTRLHRVLHVAAAGALAG